METKKMTLAEAQEFVKNTKYIVWNEDESRQLQEKLFEIGCSWLHSGKTICHKKHPFLTIDEYLNIRYHEKHAYTYFEDNKERFTETYKILNIEIEREPKKEPKPKFDPKTLQPFDKVLVRESDDDIWGCDFFSQLFKTPGFYHCVGQDWEQCIPYNDETKHLVDTIDEAPEFYQLD